MGIDFLGELDGVDGVAEREGRVVAEVELRDSREQQIIEVPMPGGQVGKRPGRITGYVAIRFALVDDSVLEEHLRQIVARGRPSAGYEFEVVFGDDRRLGPCRVGGAQGRSSESPGQYWFTLDF